MPTVPVGLNVWSRLVEATFPYFDQTVAPFDSIWLPDHAQLIRVGILIAETEREVERLKTASGARPMADIRLAGSPAQVTEALQRIVRQGATRLTVNFSDAPRPDGTLLFASEILPEL